MESLCWLCTLCLSYTEGETEPRVHVSHKLTALSSACYQRGGKLNLLHQP